MKQVAVDTDVVSFLFKNHSIALRFDPELGRVRRYHDGRLPALHLRD